MITGQADSPAAVPCKFVGILFIIWMALLYDADGMVRRLVTPLLRVAKPIMGGITRAVAVVVWPLEYVVERIAMMG